MDIDSDVSPVDENLPLSRSEDRAEHIGDISGELIG